MNIVVFEDAGVEKLAPITTGRPAYAITTASYRLIDWLITFEGNLVGLVRDYLERVQLLDYPAIQADLAADLKWTIVVNARIAPTVSNIRRLQRLMGINETGESQASIVRSGWAIAAAVVPTELFLNQPKSRWPALIDDLGSSSEIPCSENGLELFNYPHDVIDQNMNRFYENITHRIGIGNYEERFKNVFVGAGVQLNNPIIFDSSPGPIVIDDNVSIGPFSFLRGPVYIGPRSRISEHASIKDGVAIGHHCKIGGEVEATVLESYSNKQHHGFLGHSYVGSWINLGAGTCNSDLKNTYGTVNMQYGDEKVSTGMQFVGCIIGDYAKTAINTSIFTGKTIGSGAMVYGFATTNVPSFVNYARTFDQVGNLPPDVIVTTQKRMFVRRNVEQRPCDIQLIHDMYRLTADERPEGLSDDPVSL
ncbi:MAG: UDP-N-acetylglucosamine diphosphorylase/glucosamine-1-phosphate N-acetyltransferase [Mariniblastus sp.]|jgi:UDP-N-acetylglucosamine diphosphorylase/glucosamine-1-phosphate N-acetyltransferase